VTELDLSEFERVGLYDPNSADADQRRELLEYLVANHVSIDEMLTADGENRLPFIVGDREVSPGPHELTIDEVATRIDLPTDTVRRLWRALGLAEAEDEEQPQFSEADVRMLQLLSVAVSTFGDAGAMQVARTIGTSMARIAETGFIQTLSNVDGGFLTLAESPVAAAKVSAQAGVMVEMTSVIFDVAFRHHIEAAVRRWDANPSDDPRTGNLAVGFADLVGFTSLSHQLTVDQLSDALTALESIALETTSAGRGRLVKLIGDELMFVTPTGDEGCDVALTLLERVHEHELLPSMRASVAVGTVVPYEGDYFGPVVNLASRLADASRGGELLVPADVVPLLDANAYVTGAAHLLSLAGFTTPVEACTVQRAHASS
jgi:adenylate cyclase